MADAEREIGATGLRVPPLCFGTSSLGGMPDTFGYDVGEFMKLIQQSAPMGGEEKAILEALGGAMGYTSYGLHFTAKGIEIRQQMKLN